MLSVTIEFAAGKNKAQCHTAKSMECAKEQMVRNIFYDENINKSSAFVVKEVLAGFYTSPFQSDTSKKKTII